MCLWVYVGFTDFILGSHEVEGSKVGMGLRKVFESLGKRRGPGTTVPLTQSMGIDVRIQEDIQEFNRYVASQG